VFDGPALYRICVEGRISPSWHNRLEGMTIHVDASRGDTPTTTLVGEVQDQGSLAGLLCMLYELHLTVVLVERLALR
jgi:hypothetical protein